MFAGRQLRISIAGALVAGAQSETITINREPINITDKDDRGVQSLLADTGTYSVEASVEGVLTNNTLINLIADPHTATLVDNVNIALAGLGSFTGSFFFSSFELTGAEGAEALTFSATLMSSGEVPFA